MDFLYLLRVLMKKKWIILGAALTASLIAFIFTRNQEKKYKSFAQISTGFTVTDEIKVNAASDNFGAYNEADINFNNVLITAQSPTVISLLSYSLILHDLQDPNPFRQPSEKDRQSKVYQSINKLDAIRVFQQVERHETLNSFNAGDRELLKLLDMYDYDYKDILTNLAVYRLQRTDYIQIEFLSENPELSAFVVNTLYQQFLRYFRTVKSNRSLESIDTLRSLLDKKKQELDERNEQLRNEGILNVGQENSAKFEMILNQQQTQTDIETRQTADGYALQRVDQQLTAMGVNSTPGKPAPVNSNDELLTLRAAKDSAYLAYVTSGSTNDALRRKYETLKTEYNQKVASSVNNGTVISSTTGTPDQKTALLEKKSELEVALKAEAANIDAIQQRIGTLNVNLTKDASEGSRPAISHQRGRPRQQRIP